MVWLVCLNCKVELREQRQGMLRLRQVRDQIQKLIKQRYGVDIATVPGGMEALKQATGGVVAPQPAPQPGGSTTGSIPSVASSPNDVKATINLLQQSK